jgi:hypothetical protein
MALNANQELVNYYLAKTGRKCTNKLYVQYLSSFRALKNAGYTDLDIKKVMDYLVEHPPKQGFTPPYIQYVIEDTLQKIKVQEMKKIEVFFNDNTVNVKDDNGDKYKSQNKVTIKGMVKF